MRIPLYSLAAAPTWGTAGSEGCHLLIIALAGSPPFLIHAMSGQVRNKGHAHAGTARLFDTGVAMKAGDHRNVVQRPKANQC